MSIVLRNLRRDAPQSHKRDGKRSQRLRTRAFSIEKLERREMLTADSYSIWNLVNTPDDYSLVFTAGTEQDGQELQPAEGTVIPPNSNNPISIFETYSIDVRLNASDVGSSIGTASVVTVHPVGGSRYRSDENGLLAFEYSEGYSYGITDEPYFVSGQVITFILPEWGWNNHSPYDFEITSVSGTNASPAVGTVVAADVDFTAASLAGADLTGANLFRATLVDVSVGGAKLSGANLFGTLSSVITGTPATLPQGWSLTGAGSQRRFVSMCWQNPVNQYDVHVDDSVTPFDALLVLNYMSWSFGQPETSQPTGFEAPYYDVNGDGMVAPLDALWVLNFIAQQNRQANGELPVESTFAILSSPFVPSNAEVAKAKTYHSPLEPVFFAANDDRKPTASFNGSDDSAVHVLDEFFLNGTRQPVVAWSEPDSHGDLDRSVDELASQRRW